MADLYKLAERAMSMDDRVWRRHANPLSVLTRFTCLPLLVLAIWSRDWLGWGAVPFVMLAVIWIWANPRVFPEPPHFDRWTSKGVVGERVYLSHRDKVAAHHRRAANLLSVASGLGALILIFGLWALHFWATILGMVLTILPKVWFVDRMVWVLQDWRAAGHPDPGAPGW